MLQTWTRGLGFVCPNPARGQCCVLQRDTLSVLLSIDFYTGNPAVDVQNESFGFELISQAIGPKCDALPNAPFSVTIPSISGKFHFLLLTHWLYFSSVLSVFARDKHD